MTESPVVYPWSSIVIWSVAAVTSLEPVQTPRTRAVLRALRERDIARATGDVELDLP